MSLFDFLARTRTPKQRLEDAVKANDIKELDKLIAEGIDVNMPLQNHGGNTAIHFAAFFGNYLCVERLLAAGAIPDMPNDSEVTPLYNAARKEHPRAMQVLLKASPNIQFDNLWADRFWSAMLYKQLTDSVLLTLIAATPNVEKLRPNLKANILHMCNRDSHLNSLKMLLLTGIDNNEILKKIISELMAKFEKLSDWEPGSQEENQAEFRDWYKNYTKNAQSLQHYSRLVIRRRFQGKCNVFCGATQIQLPQMLKNYICFI